MKVSISVLVMVIFMAISCTEDILEIPTITGSWMLESTNHVTTEIISFTDVMTYEIVSFPSQLENPIGSEVDTVYITGDYAYLGNQISFLSANFKGEEEAAIIYAEPTIYGATVSDLFVGMVNTVVGVYQFLEFIPTGLNFIFNPFTWSVDEITRKNLILNNNGKLCKYRRL
ncbi:hypothetical protein [Plebeiibacterium sediminum]|uniref:Uncharacterized protein n=1 Tax=Plebeiibacterium sediminum TaxID=2992112 RepID=A0AAE3M1M1_9BACT|nr:hypothetical protein [Plebeiobacterium sediminum]MCW3785187.1 hypothetical protein [Plebeiobacterium sediminum]